MEIPQTSAEFVEIPQTSAEFVEIPQTSAEFVEIPLTSGGEGAPPDEVSSFLWPRLICESHGDCPQTMHLEIFQPQRASERIML